MFHRDIYHNITGNHSAMIYPLSKAALQTVGTVDTLCSSQLKLGVWTQYLWWMEPTTGTGVEAKYEPGQQATEIKVDKAIETR